MTAVSQPHQALALANQMRIARGTLKRRIQAGEITVAEVLTAPPAEAMTMSLLVLLQAQHRWGRMRALKVIHLVRVSETRRLGELTVRQRNEIASYLSRDALPELWPS